MKKIIATLPCLLFVILSWSQAPTVTAVPVKAFKSESIFDAVEQMDGKVLIAGFFQYFNGSKANCLVRLNPDGSVDNTFAIGTGPKNTPYVSSVTRMVTDSDGNIYLTGGFTSFNGVTRNRLVKLSKQGEVDPTFVPPSEPIDGSTYNHTIALAGNVVYVTTTLPDNSYTILKLSTETGLAVSGFSIGSGFNGFISAIAIQPDGKLVAVGNFSLFNGQPVSNMVRINTDGSLDTSFGTGLTGYATSVNYSSASNKLIIAGEFSSFNGAPASQVAVINLDGSIDASISTSELASTGDAIMSSATELVAAGANAKVSKFATTGVPVRYAPTGAGSADVIIKLVPLQSGKILAVGRPKKLANVIFRLHSDLTLDTSFNPGLAAGSLATIFDMAVQADGKMVLIGNFSFVNGVEKKGIVRLESDYSIDETFQVTEGFGTDAYFYSILYQPDGKLLIVSGADSYNGTAIKQMVRLNADGSIDNTFSTNGPFFTCSLCGVTPTLKAVSGANGTTMLAGSFINFAGVLTSKYLIRLTAGGTLDPSFSTTTDGPLTAIARQADGKFIIAGNFTSVNGASANYLARIHPDGSLDATFSSKLTSSYISRIYPLSSGKIVVTGKIGLPGSTNKSSFLRLEADGSIDASYGQPDIIPGFDVVGFLMPDETLLLSNPDFYRFSPEGKTDSEFGTLQMKAEGAGYINQAVVKDGSHLLVTGYFDQLGPTVVDRLAEISFVPYPSRPEAPTDLRNEAADVGYPLLAWTDNSSSETSFEVQRANGTNANFQSLISKAANTTTHEDQTVTDYTTYVYRVRARNKSGFSDFSNELEVNTTITGLDLSTEGQAVVFPNPATDALHIRIRNAPRVAAFKLSDTLGRPVRTEVIDTEAIINVRDLPSGIYIVTIDGQSTARIRID